MRVSPRQDVAGKNVTIVGAQRSGLAAAKLLVESEASVFVTERVTIASEDKSELASIGVTMEDGGHTERAISETDFLVLSPGVPTRASIVQDAMKRQIPVYSEIEVASWFCAAPMVAITGSNGKTTTTSLAAHTFKLSGRKTFSGGNIGVPFSSFCREATAESIVVLEVSSFQLDHIDSFKPDVSILLNITPDHLDRYDDNFSLYADSKLRIIENQSAGDFCVYNVDDEVVRVRVEHAPSFSMMSPLAIGLTDHGKEGAFVRDDTVFLRLSNREEKLMQVKESALRGRHNLYNTLAAAVAARVMDVRSEIVRESIQTFEGVPHRLEEVADIGGVKYINDSKATNVNALWYALESFNNPVILIAGGRDKGNDYSEVRDLVSSKVKVLIALGEAGPAIIEELGELVDKASLVEDLDDAVRFARVMSEPGDVVLLSPACASFDMFDNYEHRGDVFKELVLNG